MILHIVRYEWRITERVLSVDSNITSLARRIGWTVVAAAAWTGYVWGTRLALLERPAPWLDWARIGLSLAFAVVLAVMGARCLLRRRPMSRPSGWVLLFFGAWTAVGWVPEVIERIAATDESTGFRLVHVTLALVSLGVGSLAASYGRQLARGLIPPAPSAGEDHYPTAVSTQIEAKRTAR